MFLFNSIYNCTLKLKKNIFFVYKIKRDEKERFQFKMKEKRFLH